MQLPALLLATSLAHSLAHMELTFPAPFNSTLNTQRRTAPDPYLQYPFDCCGPGARWPYPCRGYLSLLGTPQGLPTATWRAGSQQNWSMAGTGNHYGGSCQVGFSSDGGETFRVATSYEGDCPHRHAGNGPKGQEFGFTVPRDIEVGVRVFAWMWWNREQEFNMNCAAVNITEPASPVSIATPSPSSGLTTYTTANGCSCTCPDPTDITMCTCTCPPSTPRQHNQNQIRDQISTPLASRPEMLLADIGNGCLTPKTTAELKFPNPGPEVITGDGEYPLELPSGLCGGKSYGG